MYTSELWSSQLWTQFKQLRIEAWKSQDFNGVWTRDLAIPVRRSNQLSYEAIDVGSWSFVSSNEPVKNGCEVIYEIFHILNCGLFQASIRICLNCVHNCDDHSSLDFKIRSSTYETFHISLHNDRWVETSRLIKWILKWCKIKEHLMRLKFL